MADTDVFDLSKSFMKVMKTNPACFTKVLLDDPENLKQLKENGLTIGDPGDLPATTTKSESIQTFKSFISNVLSEATEDAGGPFDARAYHSWVVDGIKGNKEFFGSDFTDPEFNKLSGEIIDENGKTTEQKIVGVKGLNGAEIVLEKLVALEHEEVFPIIKIWFNAIIEATDVVKDVNSKLAAKVWNLINMVGGMSKINSIKEYAHYLKTKVVPYEGLSHLSTPSAKPMDTEKAKEQEKDIKTGEDIFGFAGNKPEPKKESYKSFADYLKG